MKKWKRSIGLLLSGCFAFTATAQTQLIKEYNLNFYGGANYEFEFYAQHMDAMGSSYIMGGPVLFAGNDSDPVLVKVDANGTLLGVNKRYKLPGNQAGMHTIATIPAPSIPELGHFQAGINDSYTSNFMIKTDLSGAVTWRRNFSISTEVSGNKGIQITGVKYASNQKIYIVGALEYNGHHEVPGVDIVVLKVKPSNGAIEWHRVFRINGFSNHSVLGIEEGQPGKYTVFGGSHQEKSAFILSFSEDALGNPTVYSAKKVDIKRSGVYSNSDITAVHYYQGGYVIGGNTYSSASGQTNNFLFRLNNSMLSPISLSGNTGYTDNYLHPNYPLLTHITSNTQGLVLSGTISPASISGSRPYVMVVGTNGNVINTRIGVVGVFDYQSSVNCFTSTTGLSTLHHTNGSIKKLRFTNYSSLGFTCDDDPMPASNPYDDQVTVVSAAVELITRTLQTSTPTISTENITVTTTVMCEGCSGPPGVALPITTSTGGTSFCSGTPFTLYAPAGFTYYQWTLNGNAAGNGSSLNITAGGTYIVYMLDENGCQHQSTITITVYNGCVVTNAPPDFYYCSLIDFTSKPLIGWASNPLAGCNGAVTYSWEYNGNPIAGSSYNVGFVGVGIYTVTVTTPCGIQVFNITVADLLVEYINHPSAASQLINLTPTFGPLTTPPVGMTLEWTVENLTNTLLPIQTGTSSTIVVSGYSTGDTLSVTLKLIDLVKCKTYRNTMLWSNSPGMVVFGNDTRMIVENMEAFGMKASPNPSSGLVNVAVNGYDSEKTYMLDVFAANGKKIGTFDIHQSEQMLNLGNIENGVYLLVLSDGKQSVRTRMVLLK